MFGLWNPSDPHIIVVNKQQDILKWCKIFDLDFYQNNFVPLKTCFMFLNIPRNDVITLSK